MGCLIPIGLVLFCVLFFVREPLFYSISQSTFFADNYLIIFASLSGIAGLFFLRVFWLSTESKGKSVKRIKSVPSSSRPSEKNNYMSKGATQNPLSTVKTKNEEVFNMSEFNNLEDNLRSDVENISELKPIEKLDFEGFARHAANLMDNPAKYSDFITGWFFRGQAKRASKAVEEINTFLDKMRQAATSARDLQTELLKNKYLLTHQALIAIWEAKQEYKDKVEEAELRTMARQAEKCRLMFMTNFYKNADAKDLTADERTLLFTQNPIGTSKMDTSTLGSSMETRTYVNPADMLRLEAENDLLKTEVKKRNAEYDEKILKNERQKQENRIVESQANASDMKSKLTVVQGENELNKIRNGNRDKRGV